MSGAAPDEEAATLACSLDESGRTQRAAEFRQLLERALASREPLPGRLRLRLRAAEGVEGELRELIAREKRCCSFLRLDLRHDASGSLWLDVQAPEAAGELVLELFGPIGPAPAPAAPSVQSREVL